MMNNALNVEAKIHSIASMIDTTPVLAMDDVHAGLYRNPAIADYLEDLVYCVVMDNCEILFWDMQSGFKEARECKEHLKEYDYSCIIRPASESVIKLIKSGTAAWSDDEAIVQLNSRNSERTPAQQLLDNLVHSAKKAKCSDIHIYTEKATNTAKVYFGIDNKLVEKDNKSFQLTAEEGRALGALIVGFEALKSGGTSPKPFDERIPNDASVVVGVNGESVKIRYAHIPVSTPKGMGMCLRILSASGEGRIPSYAELGYTPAEEALQKLSFKFYSGIVIYTGPTGSGKSTALSAGVQTIPKYKKIISLEDPVENRMPGVLQIQINKTNKDTTYEAYAKAILRQAPNVIIYGEVNSPEVLEAAITQANTGHLVVTTLHTNTGIEAINRMVDLGASWSRLASDSLIRAIVAQRLVEKLCRACSVTLAEAKDKPWATDDHTRIHQYFASHEPEKLSKIRTVNLDHPKCPNCLGAGELGRMPIVEIIMLSKECREFIAKGDLKGWTENLKKNNWASMHDSATAKVLKGELCPITAEQKTDTQYGVDEERFDYEAFERNLLDRQNDKVRKIQDRLKIVPLKSHDDTKDISHE